MCLPAGCRLDDPARLVFLSREEQSTRIQYFLLSIFAQSPVGMNMQWLVKCFMVHPSFSLFAHFKISVCGRDACSVMLDFSNVMDAECAQFARHGLMAKYAEKTHQVVHFPAFYLSTKRS